MTHTSTVHVHVGPLDRDGDTVRFHWRCSIANPFQHTNGFFFRYEGIDLATFSDELLFEIFLGLQLRVFAALGDDVHVEFPIPLPRSTVDFWRAFHNADHVAIGAIDAVVRYSTWRD